MEGCQLSKSKTKIKKRENGECPAYWRPNSIGPSEQNPQLNPVPIDSHRTPDSTFLPQKVNMIKPTLFSSFKFHVIFLSKKKKKKFHSHLSNR